MKARIAVVLSLMVLLAVPFSYGQAEKSLGTVNVPFKFMADNQAMPAGTYELRSIAEAGGIENRLQLRNTQANISIFIHVTERLAETNPGHKHEPRAVFDTVGSQRFLSEFWSSNNSDGYLLGIKKGEHKHEIVESK